ncbi:MAG TPA: hypothetical protein VGI06_06535 [Acidimicrobiales bacterium]
MPLNVAWSPTSKLPELVAGLLAELDGPPEAAAPVPVVDVVVVAPVLDVFDGALVVVVVADEPPEAVPAEGALTAWEPGTDVVRATAGAGPDRAITARPAATAGSMAIPMPTDRRRNTGRRMGRPAFGT